jgi:hypothetical protein
LLLRVSNIRKNFSESMGVASRLLLYCVVGIRWKFNQVNARLRRHLNVAVQSGPGALIPGISAACRNVGPVTLP